MFNLCHWLRVDKSRDYKPFLKQALPRLWAISINGADNLDEKRGWSGYIQPLDRGSFDVGGLLKTLKELGYRGPIGLQWYGIAATPGITWLARWLPGGSSLRTGRTELCHSGLLAFVLIGPAAPHRGALRSAGL